MAHAKKIVGLDCNGDVYDWIREILRVRLAEILDFREAVLQSADIEAVHDMRVATRRLRTALRDFAPFIRQKPARKLKRNLKRLADALGVARDADVAIVALEELKEKYSAPDFKAGVEKIIAEQTKSRGAAQIELVELLSESSLDKLQKSFEKAISDAVKPKKSADFVSFNESGKQTVGKSLDDFCELSANIYDPLTDEPLHELRIAAKRLRYAVELYTACWGEKIAPFAEEISAMQGFLGEVHVADVWLEKLRENLLEDYDSTDVRLLSEFIKKRTKNYRRALKLWRSWQDKDFLGDLRKLVSQTN